MATTERNRHAQSPDAVDHGNRFSLGRVLATPGALTACEDANVDPRTYLRRHVMGDWGDLGDEDRAANAAALATGARILSAYTLPSDERLWIITEADRASTTMLLPLEY